MFHTFSKYWTGFYTHLVYLYCTWLVFKLLLNDSFWMKRDIWLWQHHETHYYTRHFVHQSKLCTDVGNWYLDLEIMSNFFWLFYAIMLDYLQTEQFQRIRCGKSFFILILSFHLLCEMKPAFGINGIIFYSWLGYW